MKVLDFLSSLRRPERNEEPEDTAPEVVVVEPAMLEAAEQVESALTNAFDSGAVTTDADTRSQDRLATRELFANIASHQARPIKNFIFELRRGTATKDWLEVCQPVMISIVEAAASIELATEVRLMREFSAALKSVNPQGDATIEPDARDRILSSYERLEEKLPEAFVLAAEDRQREGVIIHALLRQVTDVGHVTFEKLYAAGFTSLEALFLARKHDLAITTGVSEELCERICAKIEEHRHRLERIRPDRAESEHRARLAKLVRQLQKCHEDFAHFSDAEATDKSFAKKKRIARRERQATGLEIEVVLAELGELELIEQIQKRSYSRKIKRIEEYLAEFSRPAEQE